MAKNKLAFGALVGAAIGAVAGVLVAPKSGKETRDDIAAKADELKSSAADSLATAKSTVASTLEDTKQRANDAVDTVKKSVTKNDK